MFSLFLSSLRNTGESMGELEKAVETLACRRARVPTAFFVHQTSTRVSTKLDRNTVHVFYFLSYHYTPNQTIKKKLSFAFSNIYHYDLSLQELLRKKVDSRQSYKRKAFLGINYL